MVSGYPLRSDPAALCEHKFINDPSAGAHAPVRSRSMYARERSYRGQYFGPCLLHHRSELSRSQSELLVASLVVVGTCLSRLCALQSRMRHTHLPCCVGAGCYSQELGRIMTSLVV